MSASKASGISVQSAALNRDTSAPLYSQLVSELRKKIESGELPEGTKLPPERALCSLYGVSRITVRHAISQLETAGYVSRLQGIGTFVTTEKYEQPLAEIHSFAVAMQKLGYIAGTKIHQCGIVSGELLISNALQLDVAETMTQLQLVGLGGDSPIVFYVSYFSNSIGGLIHAAAVERSQVNLAYSTLDLYREHLGIQPVNAEQTFESIVSDRELSEILKVPEGSPILKVTSLISDATGPIEYRRAFYRGDKYKFFVRRNLASGFIT